MRLTSRRAVLDNPHRGCGRIAGNHRARPDTRERPGERKNEKIYLVNSSNARSVCNINILSNPNNAFSVFWNTYVLERLDY